MVRITKAFINKLNKDPIGTLSELKIDEIVTIIQKSNQAYYNQTPMFQDDIYDTIKEYLESKDPNNPILKAVGAAVNGDKVELPYFMGSLDKIKADEKAIEKFKHAYTCSYVVSDKLDGNSALFCVDSNDSNGKYKLYSRGDGEQGQDISHLLPFIQNIPKLTVSNLAVRGELIMSKQDFKSVDHKGANARNMVAGIINAKLPDLETAKMVQFVAYELINPRMVPEVQFNHMQKLGFKVAFNILVSEANLSNTYLSEILVSRRQHSDFEVDGIVIMHNHLHNRVKENPKHAFAFKNVQTMEKAEVVVTKVEWNVSKDGFLIPVVNFQPVKLAGVMIQKASGFNGKYIKDNKIGPGSRIVIIRSGDVIPYIVQTLTPAATGEAQMPEVAYEWSSTNIDIKIKAGQDAEADSLVELKNIQYFFDKIDVKGVSSATIAKVYNAGFKTIKSIINITTENLMKIDGFKEKSATNFVSGMRESINGLECVKVMDASNAFGRGFGEKKLKLILDNFPAILTERYVPTIEQLKGIKGIEQKTAQQFIVQMPKFFKFYDDCGLNSCSLAERSVKSVTGMTPVSPQSQKLKDVVVVFTGFRNKEFELLVQSQGGTVSTTINKKTTHLIVKDINGKESSKEQKARELGVRIITLENFKTEYRL
jgi:NAD-dependent DNA ligase